MLPDILPTSTSVFIAGGGPFGLMLANELGRRGIAVLLVDAKPGTTQNVQANATQARTGADLALIRPQVVAWRGNDERAAAAVLSRLTGRG